MGPDMFLHFLALLLVLLRFSSAFTPADNYLLSCGTASNSTLFGRVFVGDSSHSGLDFLSKDQSVSVTRENPLPNSTTSLYNTARVFRESSGYQLSIKENGTHLVRFHFSPFSAQSFELKSANFGVSVNGFSVLSDFSAGASVVKEFILKIDGTSVQIIFTPSSSSGIGFVNAIEVFSAPPDLIIDDGARLISDAGTEEYKNLTSQVLETVHRINVGGPRLTPFNDTLWRTWIPDDEYLVLKSAAKRVSTTQPPKYQGGGASREVAPDGVYMTAQQMNRDNLTLNSKFNISWDFPVDSGGFRYLVRLHFCDIVSSALNELYFNIYINGYPAYTNLDLSVLTVHLLASPYYIDFVADYLSLEAVRISVGPSDLSTPFRMNAILNGAEIMKIATLVSLPRDRKKSHVWIVVASSLGGFVGLCLLVVFVVLIATKCKKRETKPTQPTRSESAGWTALPVYGGGSSHSPTSINTATASPGQNGYLNLRIPFADIQLATNNFDKSLIIGSGGFGMVYKGVLKDNTKVAVKRGVPGSRQGLPEFQTEINVLSKIQHRHLVSLVGFCEEQSEMILVYEYMEKGSLKHHLYGSGLPPLTWKQRLKICIGAARGLHYLHTGSAQGIIHRDIKSTNILLDENYVAKVADFGLSRSGPCLDETHVSTGVKGSFGYLDPEYFRRRQLTDKSDVYSFGVVLFEVLCARPAVDPLLARDQVNLAEWALQWQKKGVLEEIVDPNLVGQIKPSSLKKFGEMAEKCLADYGVDRPGMGDVLWNLEYCLQLQENVRQIEAREDSEIDMQLAPLKRTVARVHSENLRIEGNEEPNGSLECNSNQVFSQLMNNEGR
ncbi:hypothetical protein SAY86_019119 [Trapa natans]|uniref:Protein kinase domain-containing protein n=1 Tax=Trapa natans TaxID=22666 RepID=A0AAN7LEC9_TRANT|nr:hypothetical protein SAY86_019119 [Trapa natans]